MVDRIRIQIDELLALLSGEQTCELALGQAVLEQNLAEPAAAVRGFGQRAIDGLERHQPRAHDESAEWIAPHLGRAVWGDRGRRRGGRGRRLEHAHVPQVSIGNSRHLERRGLPPFELTAFE